VTDPSPPPLLTPAAYRAAVAEVERLLGYVVMLAEDTERLMELSDQIQKYEDAHVPEPQEPE
jgi:23S rRNA maturation mini-RNase III